jgi:hypothetical protein
MKTAMQELIEWIEQRFNNPQETEVFKKATELLEKEKKQITPLIDALEDIKNWDDDLEVEWGDCGERAISALKIFKKNK